jgi:hypothetical protein
VRRGSIEAINYVATASPRYMFKKLSQTEIEDLAQFLADPQRPNDTMCFQELQGFLFAVACSPVLIPTPAWMAIVSNDADIGFKEELAISQWSHGFMMGHDWLSDVWDEHLPDELDEEFGSTAMVLSFFSSKRLGELYHLEATTTPRHRRPRVTFTEYSEKVRELFPAALSSYAHIGRTISEILTGSRESDAQVV